MVQAEESAHQPSSSAEAPPEESEDSQLPANTLDDTAQKDMNLLARDSIKSDDSTLQLQMHVPLDVPLFPGGEHDDGMLVCFPFLHRQHHN